MTKLYIANCTKFVQDFLFRIPESNQVHRKVIEIGRQEQIYTDASREVLEYIVNQHRKYGLIPLEEIDHTQAYFGMCYAFDRTIDIDRVMTAMEHNETIVDRQAHEYRKQAAAGLSNVIDNNLQGAESKLSNLEVEVVEQPKTGDNTPRKTETIQVAKPGSKAAARGIERANQAR